MRLMQVEVGLDAVGLAYEDEVEITAEAARLGYGRIWTGSSGDPFQTCALRWAETRRVVDGGIGTAIGVLPLGVRTPADLAQSAAALSGVTGGRFTMGLGAGNTYEAAYRQTWGIQERSPLALVRAYLTTMRDFLRGEQVTYHDRAVSYEGARLPVRPVPTPLYLGAAGPDMARLGGELADGLYLSWCTPENVSWARARISEGAERAQRDRAGVQLAASVRVCVDDDVEVARRALAGALLPYVVGWGSSAPGPFRRNFERMGFGRELSDIDRMQDGGVDRQHLIDAFPRRMLDALGYFGPAAGAAEAVPRQVQGADIAVVRIVAARPELASWRAVLEACRPAPADA
jgi:alkanesulfonate monooxygenase SsuD/methylene tetrahydromethanopterin reductase-like flavin-dependent oxidoreductase (luciferase family)